MVDTTRFSRIGVGQPVDGDSYFGNVISNARLALLSTTTANGAAKFPIRGDFEITSIKVAVLTAANASAKTINIGTDASVARFAAYAVSAGAANEQFTLTPASATLADWLTTGSAQGVTTVAAYWTDNSGVAVGSQAFVSINYIIRN